MFEGDYTVYGKHATYIKYLAGNEKPFNYYIDVYMTGAVFGILNNKRAKNTSTTSADRARIYADAFNSQVRLKCSELFKLAILNDTSKSWSEEEKINICFKYRDKIDENAIPPISENEINIMKEALDLFNEYAMGGIELLYENFLNDAIVGIDDTVDYAYQAMLEQKSLIESRQPITDVNKLLHPEY